MLWFALNLDMAFLSRPKESVANSPRLFFKPPELFYSIGVVPIVPPLPPRPENCPRHDLTFCTSGEVNDSTHLLSQVLDLAWNKVIFSI